jgi:hypothetical protein
MGSIVMNDKGDARTKLSSHVIESWHGNPVIVEWIATEPMPTLMINLMIKRFGHTSQVMEHFSTQMIEAIPWRRPRLV